MTVWSGHHPGPPLIGAHRWRSAVIGWEERLVEMGGWWWWALSGAELAQSVSYADIMVREEGSSRTLWVGERNNNSERRELSDLGQRKTAETVRSEVFHCLVVVSGGHSEQSGVAPVNWCLPQLILPVIFPSRSDGKFRNYFKDQSAAAERK